MRLASLASMHQATVTEVKDRLSHFLRLVKAGETVEITERSVPIALLTRRSHATSLDHDLQQLIRDGLVVEAARPPDAGLVKMPAVRCSGDVVAALIEARGER